MSPIINQDSAVKSGVWNTGGTQDLRYFPLARFLGGLFLLRGFLVAGCDQAHHGCDNQGGNDNPKR